MKINFNILFWKGSDFTNRLNNINFCWYKLRLFTEYANSKGLELNSYLFDFSENKNIIDAIHIPYKDGTYRRSEKVNLVLEYNYLNNKPDLICFLDSDIFFTEKEYDKLIEQILNFKHKTVAICEVYDILDNSGVDYKNDTINSVSLMKRDILGLGAFFMLVFDELFNIGGFDERFTVWGGEDDDIVSRLMSNGLSRFKIPINLLHLPHYNMMSDSHQTKEYHEQCKLIDNNDIVTKYSLLNKYL